MAPGEFEMGTASDRPGYFKDDQLHRVRITRAFEIGTHEVTQREWTAEMGSLPPGLQADADLPVLGVSWTDAVAFCNRLSSRLDLPEAYRSDGDRWVASGEHGGFRLPTEAEWEFAARAATDSPFAGGSDALLVAWFAGSAGGRPRPVGSLGANALGLFDMSGNAAEWVWDVYQPYPSADVVDPRADEGGDRRVIRGGSYADSEDKLRVTYRRAALPTDTPPTIGFRVARDAR
ncbi:MAG: SUMF1/EgtB/PvdO family nonheme iron enzyme [Deltaproteobacteria bacterium]|nr:SUMF1/EgtB/PvdO family nonheme iron enzyme [Deltaproteobacteria bacterium]